MLQGCSLASGGLKREHGRLPRAEAQAQIQEQIGSAARERPASKQHALSDKSKFDYTDKLQINNHHDSRAARG